jgi:hypothetical protein
MYQKNITLKKLHIFQRSIEIHNMDPMLSGASVVPISEFRAYFILLFLVVR